MKNRLYLVGGVLLVVAVGEAARQMFGPLIFWSLPEH
jgi:hypothetical protein